MYTTETQLMLTERRQDPPPTDSAELDEPEALPTLAEQKQDPPPTDSAELDEPAPLPLELGELLHELYVDLRRLARSRTRRLPPWRSLRTTGLIHEAYMRLLRRDRVAWVKRDDFLADVALTMRDIAVEYVRRRLAKRRGGHLVRTGSVSEIMDRNEARATCADKLAVFQAMERLRAEHPQVAEIVFMRFFCEMTTAEIADWLGMSTRTIERKWNFARTWLETELGGLH